MEHKKVGFGSTDITFHSREFRPTQSFERAKQNALAKGSKIIRVYGEPQLVLDPKTGFVYMGFRFSEEITKKIYSGELMFSKDTPWIIDEETKKKMAHKEKAKLKNSTRVWRSDK